MISPHCKKTLEDFEDPVQRKNICWNFREIRSVVMCKAWAFMEEEHIPFRAAINAAWDWVKDKCKETGAYI